MRRRRDAGAVARRWGARKNGALRCEFLAHCQSLSFSLHEQHRTGQIMSRLAKDLLALSERCHHRPEDLASAMPKFEGMVLLHLDPPLRLAVLASLLLAAVRTWYSPSATSTSCRVPDGALSAPRSRRRSAAPRAG